MPSVHRTAAHAILVVDDNDDIREALELTLRMRGNTVAAASDVPTALDQIGSGFLPCVVLLDLHMPRLDGWYFLDHKDDERDLGDAAVIVVSGDSEQRNRATARGCEFLLKPVRVETLLATVEQRCVRHRPARRPSSAAPDRRVSRLRVV